jgi:hypothetical protein
VQWRLSRRDGFLSAKALSAKALKARRLLDSTTAN